jgi:tRNA_anti-like
MKTGSVGLVVASAMSILVGCGGNTSTTPQTHSSPPTTKTPSTATQTPESAKGEPSQKGKVISAEELSEEFQKDEAAAENKYKGKSIEVEGIITGTHESPPLVDLKGSKGGSVGCRFFPADSPAAKMVPTLKEGQKVRIKGDFSISRNNGQFVQLFPGESLELVK